MLHASLKRTGQKMPMIGYGLWKVDNATCADTVYNAIKTGYRLFDGAGDYGNEKEAGEGLQRAIKDGLVKREEIFVTSKLWNTYHRHDHVKIMAKKQLELWGMDYFDLFLIHFPIALEYVDPKVRYPPGWAKEGEKVRTDNTPLAETWKAMEELVDEGLAKNIGVSNYSGGLVLDLVRYARIQPAALQVELHPLLAQKKLVKLAQELGIAITAYSSFGPQSYVELDLHKGVGPLLQHNVILDIANARGRTPAQVLLRWALQQGICVIPKSNNPKRLVENLGCDNFELTSEDMAAIDSLNRDFRFNDPGEIDVRLSIFA